MSIATNSRVPSAKSILKDVNLSVFCGSVGIIDKFPSNYRRHFPCAARTLTFTLCGTAVLLEGGWILLSHVHESESWLIPIIIKRFA